MSYTDEAKEITNVITVSSQNLARLWEKASAVDRSVIERLRDEKRNAALVGYLAKCLYGHP